MAIRDIFKISRKTFINPSAWIDYEGLKEQTRTIWTTLATLFTAAAPERIETFEEAKERLKLKENEIKARAKIFKYYALFFLLLSFLSIFQSFYLIIKHHSLSGFLIGLCVAALFSAQAFRFDFWSYQMRNHKLGVTFTEWWENLIGGKKVTK